MMVSDTEKEMNPDFSTEETFGQRVRIVSIPLPVSRRTASTARWSRIRNIKKQEPQARCRSVTCFGPAE